ncbi:NAD(P)-binding protein [Auriscalpium vulgare]|uniref:NAD(P)-binding protein n=1 Tax=Auriscalpium vulgare TaxID=40419 RepID=A0ACB8R7A1_9AGAM|nr:NAD(P)-binding protein [Auriscalpium vulgare]
MSRNLCITSADGQTGHLVAELLLTDERFGSKLASLVLLAQDTSKLADLDTQMEPGFPQVTVVEHVPGDASALASLLKEGEVDTIFVIPPASEDKMALTQEMVDAVREAGVRNVVLLSAAGCEYADPGKQPHLREFIDIEAMVLKNKGDTSTEAGHSPCVIRAGFYAENLLLYTEQAKSTGTLPLPIGSAHKFAPVALGDVAHVAAHVLTEEGPHGLSDKHRGQLIVLTGAMMTSGEELAAAASQALGAEIKFKAISNDEALKILKPAEISEYEKNFLLEYYALVREGKTNYVSTIAYGAITGEKSATLPTEFFKTYAQEFKPKRTRCASSP